MDLHAWITQQVDHVERMIDEGEFPPSQPEGVRLRCEADRRILNRHKAWPDSDWCDGCGPDLDTRLSDCPELLDLAHAHGITDDILASLDRPTPPEPDDGLPADFGYTMHITQHPTRPITTSDVPAALRGPRWKP
ncbi:hypothetical protein [Streptomyces sp. RB13]|uniref:hypothetical protein n=1 Tax=Streptomyces sp. RB13 TaxID=2950978 RepID=UPI002FCAC6A7